MESSHDTERRPERWTVQAVKAAATDRRLHAAGIGAILVAVLAAVVVLNAGALASGSTPQGTIGSEIDSCTTIDEPGTYTLTADIENATADTCIDVRASGVVLDGNGHTIDGGPNGSDAEAFLDATFENGTSPVAPRWANHGVAVRGGTGATNVTVRDLHVSNWTYGVAYLDTEAGVVENVMGTHNGEAIDVFRSRNVSVRDATVIANVDGVVFDRSTASELADSNASGNALDGVGLYDATDVTVVRVESGSNGLAGIYLQDGANNTLASNELANNSEAGVRIVNGTANDLTANTIADTGGNVSVPPIESGAMILVESSDNAIDSTTVEDNGNWTYVSTNGSANNTVTNLSMPNATLSFTGRDVAIRSVETPPGPPENLVGVGQFVNATNTSDDSYVFLNFSYDDADLGEVDESTLRLWKHDDGDWSPVPGTNGVDAEANVVFANVTEFSVFAPLGEVSTQTTTATPTPTPEPPTTTEPTTTADGQSVEIEYLDCTTVRVTGNAGDVVIHTGFYDESGPGGQMLPMGAVDGSKVFNPDAYEGENGFQITYVEVHDDEYPRGERIASKINPNREQCDEQIRPDETTTPTPGPTPTPEPTPTSTPTPEPTPEPTPTPTPGDTSASSLATDTPTGTADTSTETTDTPTDTDAGSPATNTEQALQPRRPDDRTPLVVLGGLGTAVVLSRLHDAE
jgi:parallel beta-helix repeat protein